MEGVRRLISTLYADRLFGPHDELHALEGSKLIANLHTKKINSWSKLYRQWAFPKLHTAELRFGFVTIRNMIDIDRKLWDFATNSAPNVQLIRIVYLWSLVEFVPDDLSVDTMLLGCSNYFRLLGEMRVDRIHRVVELTLVRYRPSGPPGAS
jgi:hypothetical protein